MAEKEEKETPPSGAGEVREKKDSEKKEPEGLWGGRFKTREEFEKSYKEMQTAYQEGKKTWGEKEKQLQELQAFQKVAEPVIKFVWKDEDTLAKFRREEVLGQQPQEKPKEPQQVPRVDPRIQEMHDNQQTTIINEFERRHGLDKLSSDEAKQMREKITDKLRVFSGGRFSPSLGQLDGWLENAYSLVTMDKLRESGEAEGLLKAVGVQSAAIPQAPSGESKESGIPTLTKAQRETADKMGISYEKYAKQLKRIQDERKIPE